MAEHAPHPRRRRREVAPLRPLGDSGSPSAATRCTSRRAASTRARASSTASSCTSSRSVDPLLRVPLVRRYRMIPAAAGAREARRSRTSSTRTTSCRTATGRRAPGSGRSSSARGGRTRSSTRGARRRQRSAPGSAIAPDRALAYVVNSQALEDAAVRLGADRAKFHRIFWHARIDGYSPEHADRSALARRSAGPTTRSSASRCATSAPTRTSTSSLRAFAQGHAGGAASCGSSRRAGGGWTRDEFDAARRRSSGSSRTWPCGTCPRPSFRP